MMTMQVDAGLPETPTNPICVSSPYIAGNRERRYNTPRYLIKRTVMTMQVNAGLHESPTNPICSPSSFIALNRERRYNMPRSLD